MPNISAEKLSLVQFEEQTAKGFLTRAGKTMEERGRQYDQPGGERSMGRAVAAFNAITSRDLSESEGWLLQQIIKDVRQWSGNGYHEDSALDGVSYAALKAEALAKEGVCFLTRHGRAIA